MSIATNKVKERIKTVSDAYKVTSAMKLVSSVKLKKWKKQMISYASYSSQLKETMDELFSFLPQNVVSPFLIENNPTLPRLFIIVSSSLGLCGAYNSNIFKVCEQELKETDEVIIFGKKGIAKLENSEFHILKEYENTSLLSEKDFINSLADLIMKDYALEKYSKVIIISSKYKNSLVFLAQSEVLLPLNNGIAFDEMHYPPLFEPNAQEVMDNLLPFYLKASLYGKMLESEVCEQASRNNAMENATKNADEILENLKIEFNKARQSSITQEIIEIVGASERV